MLMNAILTDISIAIIYTYKTEGLSTIKPKNSYFKPNVHQQIRLDDMKLLDLCS